MREAAALRCKLEILALAAEHLDLPISRLRIESGAVLVANAPEKRIACSHIPTLQRRGTIIGVGYRGSNPEGKATCPFGVQFCEVEVNTRGEEIEVIRFLSAHDSRRGRNRRNCHANRLGCDRDAYSRSGTNREHGESIVAPLQDCHDALRIRRHGGTSGRSR